MEPSSYSASAPGSIMLLGEHAVLRYNEAIVCAIDKRITITLYPRKDRQIIIRSNDFEEFITTIDNLKIQAPYEYVLGALLSFQQRLKTGIVIEIISNFSSKVGFGSSAAVTVAMVAVLAKWLDLSWEKPDIFNKAKQIMLSVQGAGSGADLAASIYGGVTHYIREPFAVTPLPIIADLIAVYSGSKLPTKEVLAIVAKENNLYEEIYDNIFRGITLCVKQAVATIQQQDLERLGRLFSISQGFMVALGVSNVLLDTLVWQLKEFGAIGAKISGSGLGDCVIGLGTIPDGCFPANDLQIAMGIKQLPIKVTPTGLLYE